MKYEVTACGKPGFCITETVLGVPEDGGMFCDIGTCLKELDSLHVHVLFTDMGFPGEDRYTGAACSEEHAMQMIREQERAVAWCICGEIGLFHDKPDTGCPAFDDVRAYLPDDHPDKIAFSQLEVQA